MEEPAVGQTPDADVFIDWKKKTGLFISSQTVSLFGSSLVQYAIIWHVTLTTKSGSLLTALTIASFLPQILISLFAGVWADRYNRKYLIMASDSLTAVSTLILAVCFFAGYQELWLIFLVSAIRSVGAGIQMPAVSALLPQIVPTEKLMRVNSINSTIQPITMIASPIIAGAMLSVSRLELIFFIDVITAAVAVGLLAFLSVPAPARSGTESHAGGLSDLRAGLVYIRGHRAVRTLFLFFAVTFFLVTPVAFLSPLLVTRSFGSEVWRLTANEITFFVGSILGGVIMTVWGGFANRFRTIGLSAILWAGLFAALGFSRDFVVYLVFMTLAGVPMPFFNASAMTFLQESVKPEMQGRVFGVQMLITNIVMPVGMLLFGPLSDVVSIETLLIVTSVFMAVPGLWLFFHRHALVTEVEDQVQIDGQSA